VHIVQAVRRGVLVGLAAGLALMGAMELGGLLGIRTLPDYVQNWVLAVTPGPVFGFFIDALQHAGKVLEEIGLLAAMLALLVALGVAAAALRERDVARSGLMAGALVWVVVCLGILPLTGEGLLGLGGGVVNPIAWAVYGLVYGLMVDEGLRPREGYDAGRRRVIWFAGAVGLAAIGLARVPGWVRIIVAPPEKQAGPTPALTPVDRFYQVSKNFQDPTVDANGWSLTVGGMAGSPFKLTYDQLKQLPATTVTLTLECVSNPVGGDLMSTGRFTGVPLRDLLARSQPKPGAGAVLFRSRDGYTESMPVAMANADPDIMVVFELDGAALPQAHGFPARLLVPGHYGMRGPKWLEQITLTPSEQGGYWEDQGWNHQAVVRTTSRIDVPATDTVLRKGQQIEVSGVAFAGERGIRSVEWSPDGGRTWRPARLESPLSAHTWTRWSDAWTPPATGATVLVVRARDGKGELQDQHQQDTYPNGASGWHTVPITIT
jgi:DMSO/TMAO reductase YedYZ molybdopterin-dependent catalytic subunit